MSFSDEDVMNAYNEYVAEQGSEEDRKTLLRILHDELELTRQTMLRSPILRERGKSAVLRDLFLVLRDTEKAHNEDYRQLIEQLAESAPDDEPVTYWQLDVTELVYVADSRIGRLTNDTVLTNVSIDLAPQRDLEEIIQGLRILRTPFYGAVVE